jgi:Ulp1 family protease
MVIPCAHIPREFIADRVIKHFVKYLDEQSQSNKTINQVLFEITSDEKYNA